MVITGPKIIRIKVITHNFQMGPCGPIFFFILNFKEGVWGVGPRGSSLFFFYFFRVGGPVVHELRQFVALTQHMGVRQFNTLTTGNGSRRAGGRARVVNRGALNYFFD